MGSLNEYIKLFGSLNVHYSNDEPAPNKAIMLISIMDLVEQGTIDDNYINMDDCIALRYQSNWKRYIKSEDTKPRPWTPFWHLNNENFWKIVPKSGNYDDIKNLAPGRTPTSQQMLDVIKYVEIDPDLFLLFTLDFARKKLKEVLVKTYITRELEPMTKAFDKSSQVNVETATVENNKEKRTARKTTKIKSTSTEYNYYRLITFGRPPELAHTVKMRPIDASQIEKMFIQYLKGLDKNEETVNAYINILNGDVRVWINQYIQPIKSVFECCSSKGICVWKDSLDVIPEFVDLSTARKNMVLASMEAYNNCLLDPDQRKMRTALRSGGVEPTLFDQVEEGTPIDESHSDRIEGFVKSVDWSMLTAGITISKKAMSLFPPTNKGDKLEIFIYVDGIRYDAIYTNVPFGEKYANREVVQIRYGQNSPIAKKLREVFRYSYQHITAERNAGTKVTPTGESIELCPMRNPQSFIMKCNIHK